MKKYRPVGLVVLTICMMVIFSACKKPDNGNLGSILGTVKNESGQLLEGVTVSINTNPGQTLTTGADGAYNFKSLPAKEYTITADLSGYTGSSQLAFISGDTKTIDFIISQNPLLLVSPSSLVYDVNGTSAVSSISITSNVSWSISKSQSWCHISDTSGRGYGVIHVTCDANPDNLQRSATLTISGAGVISQMVAVNQVGRNGLPFVIDNDNMMLGNPSGATTSVTNYDNYLMVKPQYVLSYSNSKHTPNWVSWYSGTNWLGSVSRQDDFRPDPDLPSGWYAVQATEYELSGFDRGHMCPSADRTDQVVNNSATFLMTNMIPQAPKNNQVTWANLENYCRNLVTSGSELYIVCGPYGQGGEGSSGARTTVGNGVVVPSQTWKIIVVLPNGTNDLSRIDTSTRVISVLMPNTQSVSTNAWTYYRTSVDSLEVLTGYDFLSNVPVPIQNVIEARVDRQ